jgi:hypothetical protein
MRAEDLKDLHDIVEPFIAILVLCTVPQEAEAWFRV